MKTCLLALAMISLDLHGSTTTIGWLGVIPLIAQTPANITIDKEIVLFDLYGKRIELSLTDLTKNQMIIFEANVPMLTLNL